MMKQNKPNVIMLHGWTKGDISVIPEYLPDDERNWMGWTKKELEKRGYQVTNASATVVLEQKYFSIYIARIL